MNNNFDFNFSLSNYNKIFSEKDIYIDHDNLNMDINFGFNEANLKNPFDSFDNLFINKNSRKSSYDENDIQKIPLKPKVITPEIDNIFKISEKKNEKIIKEKLNKKRRKSKETRKKNIKIENIEDKKVKFNSYKFNPVKIQKTKK